MMYTFLIHFISYRWRFVESGITLWAALRSDNVV